MTEKLSSKLGQDKSFRKVTKSCFLTTPKEVKKYVESIERMLEAKIMMQSSSPDNCVWAYITILNLFDPELQLLNTQPVIKPNHKTCKVSWKSLKSR